MVKRIYGEGGGKSAGSGARNPVEEPNTLRSVATLRVIELLSEGEIEGLVDGAKSIFLDETALQNEDDSFNFEGVSYSFRAGTPDQEVIEGFPEVESEVSVGVKVEKDTPVVRTINSFNVDAARVTITFPALTEQNENSGDITGSEVRFKIWYNPNNTGYILAKEDTVRGKTTSQYQRSYRINLTGDAPYDIKVERVTEDAPNSSVQNDMFFSAYTEIIDFKLIYPDSALIGLEVDSSLFGNQIPERAYEIKGIKVKIPSNYDPETRNYAGVWDGTFSVAWTNNPAWVYYDIVTNKRYGLGNYISETMLDKYALYEIARYCDELVDNGEGGLRPRFTFNGVMSTQEDAFQVIQSVSSAFRSMSFWGVQGSNGLLTVVQDAPKDAIKLVTNANVINGDFSYQGKSYNNTYSAVAVTWNNPENGYKADIEIVERVPLINKHGYRQKDLLAYGCTNRAQARTFGEWFLYSEQYETEVVSYKASLDHVDVVPGDLIRIADEHYSNIRLGGRILEVSGATVTIDSEFTFEIGQTYTIDIMKSDGTIGTFDITNGVGVTNEVTVNLSSDEIDDWYDFNSIGDFDEGQSNLSPSPVPFAVFVINASSVSPRLFRVLSVVESAPNEYEVSALEHNPEKYEFIESNVKFTEDNFSTFDEGSVAPPSNISLREALFRQGVLIQSKAIVSWEASTDNRVTGYQIEYRSPDESYKRLDNTSSLSAELVGTRDGIYDFRVRAVTSDAKYSPWVTLNSQSLSINGNPGANVSNLSYISLGESAQIKYDRAEGLNLSHLEVRFNSSTTGATWGNSSVLISRVPIEASNVIVPNRKGTYTFKTVTIPTQDHPNGVYSTDSLSVVNEVDGTTSLNFISNLQEHTSFAGAKTDCNVNGGILRIDTDGNNDVLSSAIYVFDNEIDLGQVFTSKVTATVNASGENVKSNADLWANVDLIDNVDGASDDSWGVEIQIRTTNDDPSGSPTWGNWQTLQIGDYVARGIQFRAILTSFNVDVTPAIEELSVSVDMPDRIVKEYGNTSSSSQTTSITYSSEFKSVDPVIQITAFDMATGDYFVISNDDETGFDIDFYNSGGTRVVRNFNYTSIGYGYKL